MLAAIVMFCIGIALVALSLWLLVSSTKKRSSVMLVLSRKESEAIQLHVRGLDQPIRITVGKLNGERVKLAIEAPHPDVRIVRAELIERPSSFQEIPDVASVS
jgi:carbon storage regulator CsrA